ncbi:MAG TPA: radical SAM protein [Polyangiaceae bacterium]|nr:radical SAM protein [Polyangiaceae bacterium]
MRLPVVGSSAPSRSVTGAEAAKTRVLLVHPRPTQGDSCTVPYSCLAIAAPLVAQGYPVEILDEFATPNFEAALSAGVRDADVLGISCFTGYQVDRAVEVARRVRALRPSLPIVWGGYHPSLYPEVTASSPLCDYVVTGQGEWVFLDLVERLARGGDPAETPGLWRKVDGAPHKNPGGPPFQGLEEFPSFPFDLVPLKSFLIDSLTPRSISYHSSLGCPFRCNFCTVTQIYERRWSGFPASRVLRDVRFLVEQTGAQSVEFYDNNFFVNDRRTAEIAQGLHDARLGIVWSGEARPDKLAEYDDGMMALLAKSGLRWVFVGAESGHDTVLQMMERDHTVAHIVEAARKLARHRIKVTFSFNLGYPQEPDDNFARTDALCRELCAINPETEIMVYITTAYEATPSFHRAQEITRNAPGGTSLAPVPSGDARTLETWKDLDQRLGEDKPWLDQRYSKKLHNFSLATFYATSFLHRRWRVRHKRNPFVGLLGALADLHMRTGYYDSIVDLRLLNRLFMETSRPARKAKVEMWTGR